MMQLTKILTLLTFFLLSFSLSYSGNPMVLNILPKDYHASNKNWSIDEDELNTYYFGNDKGLLEFNGLSWNLHTLQNGMYIRSVKSYSHDVIFTGGFEEFGRWDRDISGNLVYTSLSDKLTDPEFIDSDFWQIHILPQGVIFQSFSCLYFYDFKTVKKMESGLTILFLLKANKEYWAQKMSGDLYRLNNAKFELITETEGLFNNTTVRVLLPGPNPGELIIGTGTQGLWIFDGKCVHPWKCMISDRMKQFELNCGIKTSRNTYIFGTLFGGVFEADLNGRIVATFSLQNTLLNNSIMALKEDALGNVCVALDRGLAYLSYCRNADFHTFFKWKIGSVYDACSWRGMLLLATNQGVFYIDENKLEEGYSLSDFKKFDGICGQTWSFSIIDKELYICHNGGITKVNSDLTFSKLTEMGGYKIKEVQLYNKKVILYGSYYQLRRIIDNNKVLSFKGFGKAVYRLETDYLNNLWLAHPLQGIYRCKVNLEANEIKECKLYGGKNDSRLPFNLKIFKVGGRIAMYGEDKFYRYNEFKDIVEPDSILNSAKQDTGSLKLVTPIDDNTFWVVSENGVWKMFYDGVHKVSFYPCTEIPHKGMICNNEQIALLGASSSLFCYDNGFVIVNNDLPIKKSEVPKPRFTSIKSYGSNIHERWMNSHDSPEIPFKRNSIMFEFTFGVNSFINTGHFRYRLLGVDEEWKETTTSGHVIFERLLSGNYVFELESGDDLGNWSLPLQYRFTILKPWYMTKLAYLGYFIALVLIFTFIWFLVMKFYRRRYLRKLRLNEIIRLRQTNEKLRIEVQERNSEIVSQRSELVAKNEVILNLRKIVQDFHTKYGTHNTDILRRKVNSYITEKVDTENDLALFLIKFEQSHANYFNVLKQHFPDLTTNDLRLCACLKMNLSSKEIAALMNLTVRAVENSRYRLRKKICLTSKQTLNDFLMEIDSATDNILKE